VSASDEEGVGVRNQMDADALSADSGAETTTVSVAGARWWGTAASTASTSTDVVRL
jgi:hypothetical protein